MFVEAEPTGDMWCLVRDSLPSVSNAMSWATLTTTGAVVVFSGTVRDHAPGYEAVTAITYEAYESEALKRLAAIATRAREVWIEIDRIALWHRIGRVALGEASVHVVVSAPHRGQAFCAAEFCIDVLKASVPVWKLEHAANGTGWAETGVEAASVEDAARRWLSEHEGRI